MDPCAVALSGHQQRVTQESCHLALLPPRPVGPVAMAATAAATECALQAHLPATCPAITLAALLVPVVERAGTVARGVPMLRIRVQGGPLRTTRRDCMKATMVARRHAAVQRLGKETCGGMCCSL